MTRFRRLLAAAALCAGVAFAPAVALAHASLLASDPGDGATLAKPPARVVLTFNEAVSPLVARLIDAKGAAHGDLATVAHDGMLAVSLPDGLPNGTQTLSWRVVSADGHPVGGVVAFSIGAPSAAAGAAPSMNPSRAATLWALGFATRIFLFLGVGGAFFAAFVRTPGAAGDRLAVSPWPLALGAASAVGMIGAQGLDRLDAPMGALFDPATWAEGASDGFAARTALLVAAAAASALSLLSPWRRVAALGGLALMGLAMASMGHAATAAPQWATRPALFAHVVVAAAWIGSLPPLISLALRRSPALLSCLRRFSAFALVGVPVLIAAGVTLAYVQTTGPNDLLTTAYGRILAAKLAAFAALLGLAAVNLLALTPAVARRAPGSAGTIGLAMRLEAVAMAVILALVAGWRLTPPPRALAVQASAGGQAIHMHGEHMMAMVTLSPGRVGANRAHIDLLDGGRGPLNPQEVVLTLSRSDESVEPRRLTARPEAAGGFLVDPLFVPIAGEWRIEISARIDDFDKYELSETREFAN